MPEAKVNTQDLAAAAHDAERWARVGAGRGTDLRTGPPDGGEEPEVGLSQKGAGEEAVVRKETDV